MNSVCFLKMTEISNESLSDTEIIMADAIENEDTLPFEIRNEDLNLSIKI